MIKYKLTQQEKGYCGPATLKIIFDHYGIIKTQEEWAKLSGTTHKDGIQNEGLYKAIKSVGFSYKIIDQASFEDLKKLIQENQTAVVIWWSGDGHYSPVVDIDDKEITLADPEYKEYRKIDLITFDHLWFDFAKDNNRNPSDLQLRNILVISPK